MDDDILNYYERELTFIREMGSEFAKKYPKIAGRLLLEPDKCEDPHTERLIEAVAFLSGRVHKKIDDEFPEITESLLQILYPHYISPIPSMSVVTFEPFRQTISPGGYLIERDTRLYSKPVQGVPCQFTTKYPVTLWPVEVVSAGLADPRKPVRNAQQAVVIRLKSFNNLTFPQLGLERLRFFLQGSGQHVFHLYELLFNNVCQVECVSIDSDGRIKEELLLSPGDVLPVGFNPDEALLPCQQRSFPGYLLLFEYFCFPEKFLFFDLNGLERLRRSNFSDTMELWIYLDRGAKPNLLVSKETFRLNATPIVNLFNRVAEPIRISGEKTEYQVIPDIRRPEATEVFSVDRVISISASSEQEKEYKPFYSVRHHLDDSTHEKEAFWHSRRNPSGRKGDNGTDLFLSFADLGFRPANPGGEVITVQLTCTNRDLPGRLNFNAPDGVFETETAAPVSAINCLVKPTPTRRPSLGGALHWRLISHLSLNYLSLVDGGEMALREILKLYDFDNSPATRQQINGIVGLQSEFVTKRVGQSFCRGVQTTITFDEEKFVGTGLFLFATVLEHFLGQYVSVNSFSQLIARTLQKKERLKKWPPRNGNRILL